LPPEQPGFSNFSQNPPLKIRGARGVMKITPFIPLKVRGRFKENTYFKRDIYREGAVSHLGIWISFVIWILTFGI
jgi:hypothetical protein